MMMKILPLVVECWLENVIIVLWPARLVDTFFSSWVKILGEPTQGKLSHWRAVCCPTLILVGERWREDMNSQSWLRLNSLALPSHQAGTIEPPSIWVTRLWAEQEAGSSPSGQLHHGDTVLGERRAPPIFHQDLSPGPSEFRALYLSRGFLPLSGLFTEQLWFPIQNISGEKKNLPWRLFHASVFLRRFKSTVYFWSAEFLLLHQ